MKPIVLVLLVVTSALARPSFRVDVVPIQETPRPSSYIGAVLELIDGGDISINVQYFNQVLQDLYQQGNAYSKALAVAQTIALLGELAYGIPGNACSAANAINQLVTDGSGDAYLSAFLKSIDAIAQLSVNPESIRNSASPSGHCGGNGRVYQFEAAWDIILESTSPYNVALVNEEYCAAKRLYRAQDVRSNNIAAAITAASNPVIVEKVRQNLPLFTNFLSASANFNGHSAAAAVRNALLS